jgi:hypothetical protein
MLTIATSFSVLTILSRKTVEMKATMTDQRMQPVCRKTSCRSCFSCAFKLLYEYGLNPSAYSELYAAYQHLVTLSAVTLVECERTFSTLKFIKNRLINWAGKLDALMLIYMEKTDVHAVTHLMKRSSTSLPTIYSEIYSGGGVFRAPIYQNRPSPLR